MWDGTRHRTRYRLIAPHWVTGEVIKLKSADGTIGDVPQFLLLKRACGLGRCTWKGAGAFQSLCLVFNRRPQSGAVWTIAADVNIVTEHEGVK